MGNGGHLFATAQVQPAGQNCDRESVMIGFSKNSFFILFLCYNLSL